VRRRWAAAVVLLASVLLLNLFTPGPAADERTAVKTVAAVDTGVRDGSPSADPEGAGEPCPCEEDPSVRRLLARSPRTAGAAGACHVAAGVPMRAPVVDRGGTDIRSAGVARSPGAGESARRGAELQTFRC
jgi:hypothetical protein